MTVELKVPAVGESISEVEIGEWLKNKGDFVSKDEPVVTLESEKATVELPAPVSGVIAEVVKKKGDTAAIGEVIGFLEKDGEPAKPGKSKAQSVPSPAPPAKAEAKQTSAPVEARVMPAAQR